MEAKQAMTELEKTREGEGRGASESDKEVDGRHVDTPRPKKKPGDASSSAVGSDGGGSSAGIVKTPSGVRDAIISLLRSPSPPRAQEKPMEEFTPRRSKRTRTSSSAKKSQN